MTTAMTAEKPNQLTREPRHTHGLQTERTTLTPEQGLRDLLNLSCDVPLTRVFEDASAEIRALREGEPAAQVAVDSPPPRRRGRPPGSRNRPRVDA